MPELRVSQAATLLGVSDDTVRRWVESGRLRPGAQGGGRQTVDAASVAALMAEQGPGGVPELPLSARNRFPGIVTRVEVDGVMALVEIQAGPHRVTSLLSRESVEELGLTPGVRAVGIVKSTSVIVERDD